MKVTAYKSYLLVVLAAILAINIKDRVAFGLLLQDIKTDLDLSDTQLGLLSGIAFTIFYSLVGIPIARWADRGDRVTIITLCTFLWSFAFALCASATTFIQMLVIRIGVAVGEAGCIPPAHSLIAAYFDRAQRAKAVGTFMLGSSFGLLLGYVLAGWLNDQYGWRVTFIVLGLSGLPFAVLAFFTLQEPRRKASRTALSADSDVDLSSLARALPLGASLRSLWKNRTFRHILLSWAIGSLFGNGLGAWNAVFFIRNYGISTGELGLCLAIVYGVASLIGTYLGGVLASRYAANKEAFQLKAIALGNCFFGVVSIGVYIAPNIYVAFAFLAVATLGATLMHGPLFATIQTLVSNNLRAFAIATLYLFANLIGGGLGPLAIGALSDMYGSKEHSLSLALLTMCPGYLWAGWHVLWASRTVVNDIRNSVADPTPCSTT